MKQRCPAFIGSRAPAVEPAGIAERAQRGCRHQWCCSLQSGTCFECEDTVMGFSTKQVKSLRRNLDHRPSAHARPMGANSLTSRAGMRSPRPTASLALMAGTARLLNPAACWREKTAVLSLLSISPGCGFRSLPMARPSSARVTDRAKAMAAPLAKSTTPH